MIILKRDGNQNFHLMPTTLRQIMTYTGWRQVRRSDLYKFFKKAGPKRSSTGATAIKGQYQRHKSYRHMRWVVEYYFDQTMRIGCEAFNVEETATIRRWALAKRRKKS
jgi:hypothetical protein